MTPKGYEQFEECDKCEGRGYIQECRQLDVDAFRDLPEEECPDCNECEGAGLVYKQEVLK